MRIFLLFLLLTLNIVFSIKTTAQVTPSLVRIDPPSYVLANKSFSTSLVFTLDEVTNETVIIKFQKPSSIGISSATLTYWSGEEKIPVVPSNDNKNEIILKLDAEKFALDANTMYQILLECHTPKPISLNKELFAWGKDPAKETLFEIDFDGEKEIEEIEVYESQKTAGNSILFNENSNMELELHNQESKDIYIEFWMKSDGDFFNFFTLTNSVTNDTLLSLSKNKFGFITFPMREGEIDRNDIYLGFNSWNYFGLDIRNDFEGPLATIYVNSKTAYSFIIDSDFSINKYDMQFNLTESKSVIEIDRLKLWYFNNKLDIADKNKHFINYEADSSSVIFQTGFESNSEFSEELILKDLKISGTNLQYVKSSAPLYSKAPNLTVNIGSSYNSIVWYVQEFEVAEEFEIERSINGSEFMTVHTALADDDPLKIYYFTDEQINDYEVAYYRVKQLNKDGSNVYSAEVKIGNKEIEEFKLGQNYPNPFNPITSIYVEVILPSELEVNVYDLVGNTVAQLYDGFLSEGMHTFEFDGSSLPSGIYFYEVISPSSQSVKKMILAK